MFKLVAVLAAALVLNISADQFRIRVAPAVSAGQEALSAGDVVLRFSGGCGTGFAEVTEAAGKFLVATLIANADVGGTGGSDTITPAGSNNAPALTMNSYTPGGTNSAPALTMNSYTPAGTNTLGAVSAHAGGAVADHASHTHTYTETVNHTHTTATGTGATGNFSQVIGTIDTSSGGTGGTPTQATTATLTVATTGGVATGTTAGPSAVLTHSFTQPSAHTFTQPTFTGNAATLTGSVAPPIFTGSAATLTGSVAAPTFTGAQFDNRPAFKKVILCEKQ